MKIKQLATAFSLIALSAALTTVSGNVFAASHGGAMALAKGAPVKAADGVLVGARDMTLYTFDKDGDTAFRYAREKAVDVFCWTDSRFGYALSGNTGREDMLRLATLVYRQHDK